MHADRLLLLGEPRPDNSAGLVNQVLRCWSENGQPHTHSITIQDALGDPEILDQCRVAWLVLEQPQAIGLYELVSELQDRRVPAMLTRPGQRCLIASIFQEGVINAAPDAPPAIIAAVLRTLWNQAEVLRAMRTELAIVRLHNQGVTDQIDKIDQELRMAAQLQREFLPAHLPQQCGVEFDVLYRPASYVSGDIYDVTRPDDHHVGFFLADAVGHGVPAALMTFYIRSSLTLHDNGAVDDTPDGAPDSAPLIESHDQSPRIVAPDEAMSRLNRSIMRCEIDNARTATAVYALLDTDTNQLQLARAGHPYPLLLRPDGTIMRLGPEGAMLGVFEDENYELASFQVEPGDRLLFFSDGFEAVFPEIVGATSMQELTPLLDGTVRQAVKQLADAMDRQTG